MPFAKDGGESVQLVSACCTLFQCLCTWCTASSSSGISTVLLYSSCVLLSILCGPSSCNNQQACTSPRILAASLLNMECMNMGACAVMGGQARTTH